MSTLSHPEKRVRSLFNGDRMQQPEFHRRYEACPEDEKWELVGGVVYIASPLKLKHSDYDGEIGYLMEAYRRATPGTHVTHNASAILGEESEPQPDLAMRILPEYGGQSPSTDDDYLQGAPELVVEIAHSRRALATISATWNRDAAFTTAIFMGFAPTTSRCSSDRTRGRKCY